MTKTIKRLELARTGQHGIDGTILTLQDLREAAETFTGDASVTIGHQMARKDWAPSFGRVVTAELVEYEDGESASLVGDVELNELLAEAYADGLYKKWSPSLPRRGEDGKRFLHHLAFLGAMPPKIKDLQILKEMGVSEVDFSEAAPIDYFFFSDKDPAPELPDINNEQEDDVTELEEAKARIKVLESEKTGLQSQLNDKEKEFSDQQKSWKKGKLDDLKNAAEGKVPGSMMDEFIEFGDHVADSGNFDFADNETQKTRPAIDVLIDVFKEIKGPELNREMDFSDAEKTRDADLSGLNGCV